MASTLYLKGIEQMMKGSINLESDTIKLKYMATSYTPNLTSDNFLSDVSASEASGAPTETLASKTVTIDTGNSRVEFDAADVTENTITCSTNKFILYKDTGVAATSPLIACIDIAEGTLAPVAGTLAITFNAQGLFAVTPA
jgi:hypothetical protein